MKIFITGGTGFIGSHLANKLADLGHQVIVFTRNQEKISNLNKGKIELIEGKINEPETYKRIFNQNIDIVYHLAAVPGLKWGMAESDYNPVNVQATEELLKLCLNKIKRFIYCSSINAISRNNFLRDPYGKSKWQAEQIVLDYQKKGLATIIIRPAIVYGPSDTEGMMLKLIRLINKKRFILVGSGKNIVPFVFIDDVINAFINALTCLMTGQAYEIIGPEEISIKESVKIIAKKLNVEMPAVNLPIWLIRSAAFFSELFGKLINHQPLITQHRVDILVKDQHFFAEKAARELNYQPVINFADGLAKTVNWYKENDYL